ncbi:MAG: hypothetical protein ABSG33_06350 [Candidatus Bathyarchaeia archaeon]|jgi:hypothetical protein
MAFPIQLVRIRIWLLVLRFATSENAAAASMGLLLGEEFPFSQGEGIWGLGFFESLLTAAVWVSVRCFSCLLVLFFSPSALLLH